MGVGMANSLLCTLQWMTDCGHRTMNVFLILGLLYGLATTATYSLHVFTRALTRLRLGICTSQPANLGASVDAESSNLYGVVFCHSLQ